ncbi:MAG: response regulator, partial [Candidatus Edwardsbacteria bacterium]|nr:response regulator [Candidatus Edwardsbacteria bacterium]
APPAIFRAGGAERILLVEDEDLIREMASQLLAGLGYRVHACRNGREAVAWFAAHHAETDLVILDMIMPEMNGPEALAAMRQTAPGVKVLLSSGFSPEGEVREMLAGGVAGFLQKPYRLAELADKIKKALGG